MPYGPIHPKKKEGGAILFTKKEGQEAYRTLRQLEESDREKLLRLAEWRERSLHGANILVRA